MTLLAFAAERRPYAQKSIDISWLRSTRLHDYSSKPAAAACGSRMTRLTDGHIDRRTLDRQFHIDPARICDRAVSISENIVLTCASSCNRRLRFSSIFQFLQFCSAFSFPRISTPMILCRIFVILSFSTPAFTLCLTFLFLHFQSPCSISWNGSVPSSLYDLFVARTYS